MSLTLENPVWEASVLEAPSQEAHLHDGVQTPEFATPETTASQTTASQTTAPQIAGDPATTDVDLFSLRDKSSPLKGGKSLPKRVRGPKAKIAPAAPQNPLWEIRLIPTGKIGPNPFQPREEFSEEEMEELAASVAEHGVQTPVLVRTAKRADQTGELAKSTPAKVSSAQAASLKSGKNRKGARLQAESSSQANGVSANGVPTGDSTVLDQPPFLFDLVTGERRLRASLKAGLAFIPAIVRDDLSDAQAAELAIVENVQRSNLNIIEEGRGYKRLMLQFRYTEARIARKVGKSVPTVQAAIKLLDLPEPVQTMLLKKQLTASHGHELLKLAPHPEICTLVALKALTEKLSAASLSKDPLPNARELKRRGQIVELGYATKFDWKSECRDCPFKAFVTGGYGSYCLKPEEWRRKQEHAIELQKREEARVLEAARQESDAVVDADDLPGGSYCNLQWNEPPAGCSPTCSCRGKIADPRDASQTIPICLNPQHFRELQRMQRQAVQEQRERHFEQLTMASFARLINFAEEEAETKNEAVEREEAQRRVTEMEAVKDGLAENWPVECESVACGALESGTAKTGTAESGAVESVSNDDAETQSEVEAPLEKEQPVATSGLLHNLDWHKVAPLLVLPVLAGSHGDNYGDRDWEAMVETTCAQLGIELPLDAIFGQIDDGAPLRLLEKADPMALLLLGAAVLVRQEARHSARWEGPTPRLDFVLALTPTEQTELEMENASASGIPDPRDGEEKVCGEDPGEMQVASSPQDDGGAPEFNPREAATEPSEADAPDNYEEVMQKQAPSEVEVTKENEVIENRMIEEEPVDDDRLIEMLEMENEQDENNE